MGISWAKSTIDAAPDALIVTEQQLMINDPRAKNYQGNTDISVGLR
jgi:hypothetical protein